MFFISHLKANYFKININIIRASILSCFSLIISSTDNSLVNSVGALPNSLKPLPTAIWGQPTCDVAAGDRSLKDNLRKSNNLAYQALIAKHKAELTACRSKDPIKNQALWLRLYAQDTKPEVLANVLDRIVNRGYNVIYVEVFYDGRVLLPVSDNLTPWRSVTEEAVKAGKVSPDYDLWAEVIRQGRERGLKVYGESSTINFGYSYAQIPSRSSVLARNGLGETSITKSQVDPSLGANGQAFYLEPTEADRLFIDPYNLQAKADFSIAIASLAKRQPDGIMFDYLRYPNRKSLVGNVKDLWIYGDAARKSLLAAMPNEGSRQLMAMYLDVGKISPEAIVQIQQAQSQLAQQNNTQALSKNPELAAKVAEQLLWQLAVNHARQGILNFLNEAIATINNSTASKNPDLKISIGTVFYPSDNLQKSGAYDPRMQPWDRFPLNIELHPTTYATCSDGKCVANQVMNVIKASNFKAKICPVLAGTWGQSWRGHPSFEVQIQAIKAVAPKISCVSHFMYEWVEPDSDRERKAEL